MAELNPPILRVIVYLVVEEEGDHFAPMGHWNMKMVVAESLDILPYVVADLVAGLGRPFGEEPRAQEDPEYYLESS